MNERNSEVGSPMRLKTRQGDAIIWKTKARENPAHTFQSVTVKFFSHLFCSKFEGVVEGVVFFQNVPEKDTGYESDDGEKAHHAESKHFSFLVLQVHQMLYLNGHATIGA